MLERATLSREHHDLAVLADAISAQVDAAQPDFEALGALRWRFSRILLAHLAKEDKLLYPQLRQDDRPAAGAIAARFSREMGDLARAFTDYVEDWPVKRAQADWSGFATATRGILHALRNRIQREEAELYPLLG